MSKLEIIFYLIISELFLGGISYILLLMLKKDHIVVNIIFSPILMGIVGFMMLLIFQAVELLEESKEKK